MLNEGSVALDLSAFYKRYEGGGSRNQPFHPGARSTASPDCVRREIDTPF